MTNQKYEDLLIGFAEVLKEKKSELFFKDLEVDRLRTKLKAAEEKIKQLEGEQINIFDDADALKTAGE